MQTLGDELGADATVDYVFFSGTAKVYADGDVEMAKRAAFIHLPALELALIIDKDEKPKIRQQVMLNLPKEW